MNTPFFTSRRWVSAWLQAAIMFTLPFIRVHGESALRFDIPSLKLYLFGSVIWVSEKYFFMLLFLLFLSGLFLFTVLYGRAWCGWVCPQTAFSHFARKIDQLSAWFGGHRLAGFASSRALLLLLSMIAAANIIWYFVPPGEMMTDLFMLNLGPWTFLSWVFITVLLYLNTSFIRVKSCESICPYAKFADSFSNDRTQRPRLRVLGPAMAFAFIAVLFAYQLYVRVPLDFWVSRDESQPYTQAGKQGDTINVYSLIVENRSLDPEAFHLSIAGIKDAQLIMIQNPFILQPNSAVEMKVFVRAHKKNLTYRSTQLRFILENVISQEIRIEQEAVFVYPERSERGLEI
jgi:IG-like fold at C-terminal of FixG, putative oxidoreductase/4Fe-4S binding domain